MRKPEYEKAVAWCRGIADGTLNPLDECISSLNSSKVTGLCEQLLLKFDILLKCTVNYNNFPNYSGSRMYPVNTTDKTKTPGQMYRDVARIGGFWDYDTEYGKNRREFTLWVANELEKLYEPTK